MKTWTTLACSHAMLTIRLNELDRSGWHIFSVIPHPSEQSVIIVADRPDSGAYTFTKATKSDKE